VLILRIKQAESALADGLLDEAYKLAQAADFRQHRRGQQLAGRLAQALTRRGREHLDARRLQQALKDCNQADKLIGSTPEVAELRALLCNALEEKMQQGQGKTVQLDQIRKHIENNWLSTAEEMLSETPPSPEVNLLVQQVQAKRLEADAILQKSRDALNREDFETVVELLLKAGPAGKQNQKLAELARQVCTLMIEKIRRHLEQGRIDLAQSLLKQAKPLAAGDLEVQQLARAIQHCRHALEFLTRGQPHQAAGILRKLKTLLPGARWLDAALQNTCQSAESLDSLLTGPLGLALPEDSNYPSAAVKEMDPDFNKKPLSSPSDFPVSPSPAGRFLLQIDGVGSYLVVCKSQVTVGPISSSQPPDVGLIAEPNLHNILIERSEEDYFLHSESPISVNDKMVTEKLLADSDSIALSPRCRFKFRLPNPASTTALLALSAAHLPRADVRQVLLPDREILIGPQSNCHIPTPLLAEPVILYWQNGQWFCRTKEPVLAGAAAINRQQGLPLGTPLKTGPLSMVITEFH